MREVALKPLLTLQLIKGRIFTLDAMHTQRELCAQVHRLEGDYLLVAKNNQTRHEVVYGLSSLSMRHAPQARKLSLVRDHWAIENKLHYRRDGSLGEDACQTRIGPVLSLLAQLNSATLMLFLSRLSLFCSLARVLCFRIGKPCLKRQIPSYIYGIVLTLSPMIAIGVFITYLQPQLVKTINTTINQAIPSTTPPFASDDPTMLSTKNSVRSIS